MSELLRVPEYLAVNIVNLRNARKLSQYDLSRAAGVPRSTINHLESGTGNPSLQNLLKLSTALGINVDELLARPTNETQLVRKADLQARAKTKGRATIYNLLPNPIRGVELERMEIQVGGSYTGTPHLKGTKEYFNCVQGSAQIYVAGEAFNVSSGEVLVFPGDEKHSYRNSAKSLLVGISAVIFGR